MSIFKRKTKTESQVNDEAKRIAGEQENKTEPVKEVKVKKEMKKSGAREQKPKLPEQRTSAGLKSGFKIDTTVLIRPVITEKGTGKQTQGCYIFEVTKRANKFSVMQAIREIYRVQPVKVNIIRIKGKKVRYGRSSGRTKARKKAMVFLNKNDKIEFIKK